MGKTEVPVTPEIPLSVRRKVRRNKEGKWVYCLGEFNAQKNPGLFSVYQITDYTDEASARSYFTPYLESGGCFLMKLPQKVAVDLRTRSENARKPKA